jgi:hypothetical protein
MKTHALELLSIALFAAACASPDVSPPGQQFFPTRKPMPLIEGPTVPPPENDIPEWQRIEWFERQNPPPPPVERVERVYVHEPVEHVHERPAWDGWYLPISLSLGYFSGWGGHHHDHHDHGGWGWGVALNSVWWH